MIKDTELRRFNLVSVSETTKIGLEEECEIINIWEVDQIKENEISVYNRIENIYETLHIEYIFPIELTEVLLLKLGVEKLDMFNFRLKKCKGNINYFYKSKKFKFNFHEIDLNIKYVHQLQNLYFTLVGEELVFSSNNA